MNEVQVSQKKQLENGFLDSLKRKYIQKLDI